MNTGSEGKGEQVSGLIGRARERFSGLPEEAPPFDPARLAQLANEFFAALPGQTLPGTGGMPPVPGADTIPRNPDAVRSFASSGLSDPFGIPSLAAVAPAAAAARLPQQPPAAPSSGEVARASFYFLDAVQPAPTPTVAAWNLRARDAAIEPLPTFGSPRSAMPPGVDSDPAAVDLNGVIPSSQPVAVPPRDSTGTALYFLDESHSFAAPARPAHGVEASHGSAETVPAAKHPAFDAEAVRRDFPILNERVHGRPLVWLDNAATTQKPQAVIDRLANFYLHENSNIHRAAHELAARSTDAYEAARDKVARFLHASSSDEIVFVRGATEAINLVAQSWGRRHIGKDDEIVITWLEHHANIVPWQQLCAETGARLRVAPVDDSGQILLDEYERLLGPRTRLVAFTQVSNALGTVTPARQMVEIAHRYGARVLVDGAQAVSHMRADVQALDCDWYVFSGHKVFAPTGIGVLYGKGDLLDAAPPWQGGGNMIVDVTFEKIVYQTAPARFEAGTGNIADAVGLGAAIDYVERIGLENIARYEHDLLLYATRGLGTVPGLRLIGTAADKAGVLSFTLEGFRTEEVGAELNREGIAVRSGHHCAQPILRRFGLESTVRPSLALYNTCADIDALVASLRRIRSGRI